jgi:hypothetical protein
MGETWTYGENAVHHVEVPSKEIAACPRYDTTIKSVIVPTISQIENNLQYYLHIL